MMHHTGWRKAFRTQPCQYGSARKLTVRKRHLNTTDMCMLPPVLAKGRGSEDAVLDTLKDIVSYVGGRGARIMDHMIACHITAQQSNPKDMATDCLVLLFFRSQGRESSW
eukprot:385047-Pelagomonas_calceolata.AAC.1